MKAFPQKYPIDASQPHHWINNPLDRGMDLRDYFAASVMQGLMASQWQTTEPYAEYVYKIADAMMEARK